MPKYTMRDVARLAGVSVATVSAVINGSAVVSQARAQRVREAMQALDYHPDQVARSLKVGRTDVIGMVIPDITNAFFPEVVRGVEDAAHEQGFSVILCNSNEDPERERRQLNELFARRVDGVLLVPCDSSTPFDTLARRRLPIVFVDRIPVGLTHGGVATDNIDAGYRCTEHLISLGHQRIAFLAGRIRITPHADRLEGFRRSMQERGLVVRNEYLRMGDLQIESGYQHGIELLSLPTPPTAIISSNNKMLLGLMRAIAELRVPCPGRVSVIGFDDFIWTQHFTSRLTVLAQRTYEIGVQATKMLLARIAASEKDTPPEDDELILLKAELRVRESTGAAPAVRGTISAGA